MPQLIPRGIIDEVDFDDLNATMDGMLETVKRLGKGSGKVCFIALLQRGESALRVRWKSVLGGDDVLTPAGKEYLIEQKPVVRNEAKGLLWDVIEVATSEEP